MRRWILRTTLAVTLFVIAVLTAATWWAYWASTTARLQAQVEHRADDVAIDLRHTFKTMGVITESDVEEAVPADHRVELSFDESVESDAGSSGDDLVVGKEGSGPTSEEHIAGVGTLRLIDATGELGRSLWFGGGVVAGVALLLTALAVVLALRASRRLTEPITELVAEAERLGSGDLRTSGRRYGIAEFDQLADSLDAAVRRVAELLAEERSLTLDASHQLKTPLTALSLRLEELAQWPDDPGVRDEASAALEQVERLSGVVDELLLDRRSPSRSGVPVALRTVVDQQVSEWRPAFDAVGRRLVATVDPDVTTSVDFGPVGQVVSALIENSLLHGAGRTSVEVKAPQGTTWIEVFDEGGGVPDELASRVFDRDVSGSGGTGLGLAAAQDAAVSIGGRLALVRRRPAHFRFFLNSGEDPSSVGPEAEQGAESDSDDVGGDVVGQR